MFADDVMMNELASEQHLWQIDFPLLRKSDYNREIHLGQRSCVHLTVLLRGLAHSNTNATLSIRFPIFPPRPYDRRVWPRVQTFLR